MRTPPCDAGMMQPGIVELPLFLNLISVHQNLLMVLAFGDRTNCIVRSENYTRTFVCTITGTTFSALRIDDHTSCASISQDNLASKSGLL